MNIIERSTIGKFRKLFAENKDRKREFLNAKKLKDSLNEGCYGAEMSTQGPIPIPPPSGQIDNPGKSDWFRRDYKRVLRTIEDCLDQLYSNLDKTGLSKENAIIKKMLSGLVDLRQSITTNKIFNEERLSSKFDTNCKNLKKAINIYNDTDSDKTKDFMKKQLDKMKKYFDSLFMSLKENVDNNTINEMGDPDKEVMKQAKKDKEQVMGEDEVSNLQDKEDERMKKKKDLDKNSKRDKEQAQDKISRAKERKDREAERERKQDDLDEKMIDAAASEITGNVSKEKGPKPPTKKTPARLADKNQGETKPEVLKAVESISKHESIRG